MRDGTRHVASGGRSHRGAHTLLLALSLALVTSGCATNEPRDGRRAHLYGPGSQGGSASGQAGTGPAGTGGQATAGSSGPGSTTGLGVGSDATTGAGSSGTGGAGTAGAAGTGGSTAGGASGGGSTGSGGAGGGGSAVGVTSKQITFSVSSNFSGPGGQVASRAYDSAFGTWTHDVNQRGGILGRQVRVLKLNDEDNSTSGREVCKQVQSNGSLFAYVMQSNTAVVDCVGRSGIPAYAAAIPKDIPRPHVHSTFLDPDRGRLIAQFARDSLGGKTKKAGIIYVNNPQYKSVTDAFVSHARSLGMAVAPPEAVAPNQASFTSELLRLQRAGAQIVAIAGTVEAIGILRDARAISYEPTWTGVVYCVDEFSTAAVDLFRGVRCLRFYVGAETPAHQEFRRKADAAGQGAYATTTALAIYGQALILERAMRMAGPNLTRERFEAAFAAMRFDNAVLPPVDWTTGKVYGARALYAVECCSPDRTWRTLRLVSL